MKNTKTYWRGRKCLITGGMGFGGSHLTEQLLKRGAHVYVLDQICPRNSYMVLTGLLDQVEYITGDIRDVGLLRIILDRFEIEMVFHLAAQPIVPMSNTLPLETLSINAMGTYSVLDAIRTSQSCNSLVFSSSGAYYGTTTQDEPIPEDAPPIQASNIYAPSKVAGDIAVRCYSQIYNMKTSVCRFINTYGPGKTEFSTIVPRTIKTLIDGDPYDFGDRDDGTTVLDYMHVRDMALGYIAAAEHMDKYSGEAFNFGGSNPISVADLVKLISRIYDSKEREPIFHGPKKKTPIRKCLDTSKAHKLLGWQSRTPLSDGLKETIQWYQKYWDHM
ncbi:MAG: GDP-mannose 4,6-dehydratase [Chloroflexota bacterium]|nr:GDP-mannose 4,6-dehydratase [Chloroflexota bacterium]